LADKGKGKRVSQKELRLELDAILEILERIEAKTDMLLRMRGIDPGTPPTAAQTGAGQGWGEHVYVAPTIDEMRARRDRSGQ
jgi:hypothetical protein